MPSGLQSSPRILKGAFIAIIPDSQGKISSQSARYLVFQYNPETLTRKLARPESKKKIKGNIFTGFLNFFNSSSKPVLPRETYSFTLEFNAADYLEIPEKYPNIVEHGLHSCLAMLESMISPQITPSGEIGTELPLVLFHWGTNRILPVCLKKYTILEEAFDPKLNPIRVKIQICMQVLDISDFERDSVGYNIAMQNILKKNMLAQMY